MKPIRVAGEGDRTTRARSLVASSQPTLPRDCTAPHFGSETLSVRRSALGKRCLEKNEERRNACAVMSLPTMGSVLLLRVDVPFLGCLLFGFQSQA